MNRLISLILVICLTLLSLASCDQSDANPSSGTTETQASDTTGSSNPSDVIHPSEEASENTAPPESETVATEPLQTEPETFPTESLPIETEPTEPVPTESVPAETLPSEPEITEPVPTQPPHIHDYRISKKVDATCTGGGYTEYTCAGCGDRYKDNVIIKLGHAYGDWIEIARDGIDITQQSTCSRCGDRKTRETLDYPAGNYVEGPNNSSYMYQEDLDACARKIYEITKPWIEADLSEFERAEKAFLYLRENVSYLFSSEYKTSNLVGPILNGKADCWGYSSAFQYLCHALGLECYFVIPVNTSNDMHRWNIVRIDGQYYHVDAQVGLFLMSDKEAGANEDTMKNYPACPESSPYGDYWYCW